MSIQRRLAVSITVVLLVSLVIGFGLTYQHVLSKVRTELQAAITVGADGALNALDRNDDVSPAAKLRLVVGQFDGDRHVKAVLRAPDGGILLQSRLVVPEDPAPAWFYRLVASRPLTRTLVLPEPYGAVGTLTLTADPHNEVAEGWSDMRLTLTIMAVFFAMVLALAFVTIRAALSPIRDVCEALARIGAGDYSARIRPDVSRELEPLRDGVNGLAMRLEDMGGQNRALHEQILSLQEEERAELARDLHDEVGPFLFAVGADAAMIRQYLAKQAFDDLAPRAEAISDAVRHMQRHLRDVLRRLAPSALLDLGLAGAIDNLVLFWTTRRRQITFSVDVKGDSLDPPFDAIAFRVVQESFSNAIRHGHPSAIDVTIDVDETTATIVVEDDGSGFPGEPAYGFGLTGMRDRVRSVGGRLAVRNRAVGGVMVEAVLPLRERLAGEEREKVDVPA